MSEWRPLRTCDVDGCKKQMAMLHTGQGDWERPISLRHGEGEAVKVFEFDALFVTEGYQGWVREVHQFEAQRPHTYEPGGVL